MTGSNLFVKVSVFLMLSSTLPTSGVELELVDVFVDQWHCVQDVVDLGYCTPQQCEEQAQSAFQMVVLHQLMWL